MDNATLNNNPYDKLINCGRRISLDYLKEHGLATNEVLIDLFNSEIDTITYEEALSAATSESERKNIWRRRKNIISKYRQPDLNEFWPCLLLNIVDQYYLILKMRDRRILLSAVMQELSLPQTTMHRILREKNITILKNKYITKEDYGLIKNERSVSVKEAAARLNITRLHVYQLAKKVSVPVKRGYLTSADYQLLANKYKSIVKGTLTTLITKFEHNQTDLLKAMSA